ncbi:MAG TPA: ferritin-like domain-containing protein [Acidimicrobiales bacterium]|nr:ferritin-like domain-containing protein [Acidimicrobiales bacterium]
MTQEIIDQMDSEPTALEQLSTASFNRRRFLIGSGLAAGLAVVTAACGSDDDEAATTDTTGTSDAEGGADGDLAVAEFAAGLEVLAVGTYKAALDAATANKLGAVPPAVAEFVKTAMSHHEEHLAAWNKVITGAGRSAVSTPNAQLKPVVDAEFGKAKTVADAAKLARTLEETAAATYLSAIPSLKSDDAVKLAASIQAIDAKHVAILNFVLGEYPVPDVFAKTDKAAKPA